MAITYTTWNPSDKGTNLTLSGGNLTVTKSSALAEMVRSLISKGASSGKWYWEVTMSSGNHLTGIANSSATTGGFVGVDINGWGYYEDGRKYNNGTLTAYGASYTNGDVIGVGLDYSGATASVTFYKNGTSQGVAFSGLSGNLFGADSIANTASTTTNFGATAQSFTPAGYNAGLYEITDTFIPKITFL